MEKMIRIINPDNSTVYVVTSSGTRYSIPLVPGAKVPVAPESMGVHRVFYDKDEAEVKKITKEILRIMPATTKVEVSDLYEDVYDPSVHR